MMTILAGYSLGILNQARVEFDESVPSGDPSNKGDVSYLS